MPFFKSIKDKNIDITALEYCIRSKIKKTFDINNIIGCLNSIFSVVEKNIKNGMSLRFKRVSNYNEMDSKQAYVVEMLNKNANKTDIVDGLVENYNISKDDAQALLSDFASKLQILENVYKDTKIKIKNNPGFLTLITQENYDNILNIIIKGINNIKYLPILSIYIDSILRLIENPKSTGLSNTYINNLCEKQSSISLVEIDIVDDENEKPIENINNQFQEDKYKLDIDLFSDDDDEIDIDDELNNDNDEEQDIDTEQDQNINKDKFIGGSDPNNPFANITISDDSNSNDNNESDDDIDIKTDVDSEPEPNSDVESIEFSADESDDDDNDHDEDEDNDDDDDEDNDDEDNDNEDNDDDEDEDNDDKPEEIQDKPKEIEVEIKDTPRESPESLESLKLDESEEIQDKPEEIEVEDKPEEIEVEDTPEEIEIKDTPEEIERVKIKEDKPKQEQDDESSFIEDYTGRPTFPNLLWQKMKRYDPILFANADVTELDDDDKDDELNKTNKLFKQYSRSCPYNNRRVPVLLTDKEKERIDKENPGSYEQALKLGSDADKQYWYICPRYWDFNKSLSLTREQALSGKYGKIFTNASKPKVAKGENIMDFTNDYYSKDVGYPGILDAKNLKDCVPCCYNSWDKPKQKKLREGCLEKIKKMVEQKERLEKEKEKKRIIKKEKEKEKKEKDINKKESDEENSEESSEESSEEISEESSEESSEEESNEELEEEELKKERTNLLERKDIKKKEKVNDYIKGSDKFPLAKGRYGYLPIEIQLFLQTDNKKCQISNTNTNLKKNYPCLLRKGVENNRKQSFISVIQDIYMDIKSENIDTIKDMKQEIINALDIDIFNSLQNGTLVDIFNKQKDESKIKDINIEEYNNSNLYTLINKDDAAHVRWFKKTINAYNNYKDYLNDDNILIDYKFIWDLISTPNKKLFKNGLNIVILEVKNDDITNKVSITCPSNVYSNNIFDENKLSSIILKVGNMYEPIYLFLDKGNVMEITKRFKIKDAVLPNIRDVLLMIKRSITKKCLPLKSLPKEYMFTTNDNLKKVLKILNTHKINLISQIINFNGKVIGVIIEKHKYKGIIPCYPSPPNFNLKSKFNWMDEIIGDTYVNTLNFLNYIYKTYSSKIKCRPVIKLINDGLIVGIITETNQVVPLSEPTQDTFGDDLKIMNDSNYIVQNEKIESTDKQILTSKNNDVERIKLMKQIKLENNFFNVFRNTIRVLLGEFDNRKFKKYIEKIINSESKLYLTKIKTIYMLLKKITKEFISFIEYDDNVINELSEITNCYNLEDCDKKKFCLSKQDGTCSLLIPKTNLINKSNNEQLYYSRLADELVRYNRINTFILKPKQIISFNDVKYNLRDDEIIILESLLTQEYFENLIPESKNSYIENNSFFTANPLKTQNYTNTYDYSLENKDDDVKKNIKPKVHLDKTIKKDSESENEDESDSTSSSSSGSSSSSSSSSDDEDEHEDEELGTDKEEKNIKDVKCDEFLKVKVAGKWKEPFPVDSVELVFPSSPAICSFDLILTLIKSNSKGKIKCNKLKLKEILIKFYTNIMKKYKYSIIEICKQQGKINFSKQLKEGKTSIESLIMSDSFYITNIDLWVLAIKYSLPIILYTSTKLKENNKIMFIMNDDDSKSYYFIKSPGYARDKIPSYRLLKLVDNKIKIPLSEFSYKIQTYIKNNKDKDAKKNNIIAYLEKISNLIMKGGNTNIEKLNYKINL